MADKDNSFGEIKKAIIGVVTLAITTAGGLFIANMEKIFDSDDEVKQEVVSDPFEQKESSKDTIVVIKKETPVVAKPEPQEKKEFDW